MNVLDLFSGIGGFSLGLERAGMRTVAFCECDRYARAVLAKHWPSVPCYDDVRTLTADRLATDGIRVDVICGGFPCQDISVAGNGAGLAGERSGLWREYARLIGELRPQFVIVENVAALLSRGLAEVLGELAALGFDAEWHCIPASAVGANHQRDRIWIIAYPGDRGLGRIFQSQRELWCSESPDAWSDGEAQSMADTQSGENRRVQLKGFSSNVIAGGQDVADSAFFTERESTNETNAESACRQARHESIDGGEHVGDANDSGQLQPQGSERNEWRRPSNASWWRVEPNVGRVANGVPSRVDRLRCLGNAVVPQIPEIIGRAIMRIHNNEQ